MERRYEKRTSIVQAKQGPPSDRLRVATKGSRHRPGTARAHRDQTISSQCGHFRPVVVASMCPAHCRRGYTPQATCLLPARSMMV